MKQILKYIISTLQENLKFAEGKHGITIALSSGVVVFAATFFSSDSRVVMIFASLSICFCALSIILSFVSLSAKRISSSKQSKKMSESSLIYYENIASFSPLDYLDVIKQNYSLPLDYVPDGFDIDLAKYIIANAAVIKLKYKYFNYALLSLFAGVSFVVICSVVRGIL